MTDAALPPACHTPPAKRAPDSPTDALSRPSSEEKKFAAASHRTEARSPPIHRPRRGPGSSFESVGIVFADIPDHITDVELHESAIRFLEETKALALRNDDDLDGFLDPLVSVTLTDKCFDAAGLVVQPAPPDVAPAGPHRTAILASTHRIFYLIVSTGRKLALRGRIRTQPSLCPTKLMC